MKINFNKRYAGALLAGTADLVWELPDELAKCKVNFIQGDFPSQVGVIPAPAVAGDFCDTNPRYSVDAGPGGLVAGSSGLFVGRFAWATDQYLDADNAPAACNNFGAGLPTGFVHREQQGLITQYLSSNSMFIPQGFGVTLMSAAGLWVVNSGTTVALPGMFAFANFANGLAQFGAGGTVGSTGLGALSINGSIGAQLSTFNGSINGNVLTVFGTATQFIPLGAVLSAGTAVPSGTFIVSQISGVSGSAGGATYALSNGGLSVLLSSMSVSYGVLTAGTVTGGLLAPGMTITASGTALPANSYIGQFGVGAGGGAGTYYINNSQTNAGPNFTVQTNIQTKFVCLTTGKPGELVKIANTYRLANVT